VQEFCNGGSLGDAISDGIFGMARTRMHWRRVVSTLLDVARGMAYIHSMRICHGDLNPANVLLQVRLASSQTIISLGNCTWAIMYRVSRLLQVRLVLMGRGWL
jgi:serine/threonine protein kinase